MSENTRGMRTITLKLSDKAYARLNTSCMSRLLANVGQTQDFLHELGIRIVRAKDGDTVTIRLAAEAKQEEGEER